MQSIQQQLAPSPEQAFTPDWPGADRVNIWIKRDDLLHPIISGNKWRKLKYALEKLLAQQPRHIISFGGGYSNHLHALAYCCYQLQIKLTAVIRGDYSANLTPMLQDLLCWGSDIQYVERKTYRLRHQADYLVKLKQQYPDAHIIPEGGSQVDAIAGVAEIVSELTNDYDYILSPVASGGTLAGLITATEQQHTKVIGIAVLKGQGYLENLVKGFLPANNKADNWQILHQFHQGGYGKTNEQLTQFCQQQTAIPLEPVYSGKLFYAVQQLIAIGYFQPNSRILLLHTGGLQGARHNI